MKNLDMYQIRKKLKSYFPELDMKVWADAKHANLRLPEYFAELKLAKNGEQICIGTPLIYTKDGQPIESPKFSALVAKTCGLDMERLTCEQIVTVVNTIKTLRANVIKDMQKDEPEKKESDENKETEIVAEKESEKPQNNYRPNNGYQNNHEGMRKPYNGNDGSHKSYQKPNEGGYRKPHQKSEDDSQNSHGYRPYNKPSDGPRPFRKDYHQNKPNNWNNPRKDFRRDT